MMAGLNYLAAVSEKRNTLIKSVEDRTFFNQVRGPEKLEGELPGAGPLLEEEKKSWLHPSEQ